MARKVERQAARLVVAEYHQAQLAVLVARVGEAVERYRAGEFDPFDVDRVPFQYSRAAKELWKFCNYHPVESVGIGHPEAGEGRLVGTQRPKGAIAPHPKCT